MIDLVNISKAYRTRTGVNQVLDHISVRLPIGENLGILGRNGAGKSTLLRIIGGIEIPDEGEVIRRTKVSWPIGFGGGFSGLLTGAENTRFVARIYGADIDAVSRFTLDFSELGDYFFMPVRTYSSGMRARLAFGLSMAINFSVYLIDEVTAVGDKPFQEKCRVEFAKRRESSSVIIVSHSLNTLRQYADKCGILKNGKLLLFDTLKEAEEMYEAA